MNLIKKILFRLLGMKAYLQLISKIYIKLILRNKLLNEYPEIHFLKKIVSDGDTCIDIGANLGYYSTILSSIVGANGKVYAVEPIPLFGEIWKKNIYLSRFNNLTLFPYALGKEESLVQMGIPERDGVLHHGMTKITSTGDEHYVKHFDVEMKNPDALFSNIEKVHFIKCDVEGYEHIVFGNMQEILKKHKPLIQSELGGKENRESVISLLESMGYTTKVLKDGNLIQASNNDKATLNQDFYFIPS